MPPGRGIVARAVYFGLGVICVGLGIAGFILPLLPGTVFLLLAAFCFARSSTRAYTWLTTNRWFGSYVRFYYENRGIPRRARIIAITVLWACILFSAWLTGTWWITLILLACAIGVTIYLVRLPTLERPRNAEV